LNSRTDHRSSSWNFRIPRWRNEGHLLFSQFQNRQLESLWQLEFSDLHLDDAENWLLERLGGVPHRGE